MTYRFSPEAGRLRVRGTPPKPKVYSGHWRTDENAVVSGPELRTLSTNWTAGMKHWNESLGQGKFYFEYHVDSITNTVAPFAYEAQSVGFGPPEATHYSPNGIQWYSTLRTLYRDGQTVTSTSQPGPWALGQYHLIAYDTIARQIWFGVDGVWHNGATIQDIEAGLKPTITDTPVLANTFMVQSTYGDKATFTATLNNGQEPFQFTCPEGFAPMGTLL